MFWFVGFLIVRFVIIFYLENAKLAYQIHFAFVIVSADNEQKLRHYTIRFYVKPAKTECNINNPKPNPSGVEGAK